MTAEAPDALAATAGQGRAAWADLPPIGRTVEPTPLTVPALEFAVGLAGSHVPAPILRPLGHDAAADGPGGLVSDFATPILAMRARTRAMDALPAPIRPTGPGRRAERASATPGDAAGESASDAAVRGRGATRGETARDSLRPVAAASREARRLLTAVRPETLQAALSRATPGPAGSLAAADAVEAHVGGPQAAIPAEGTDDGAAVPASRRPARDGATRARPTTPDPYRLAMVDRTAGRSVTIRRAGLGAPLAGPPPVATRQPASNPVPPMPPDRTAHRMLVPAERNEVTGGEERPLATLRSRGSAEAAPERPAPPRPGARANDRRGATGDEASAHGDAAPPAWSPGPLVRPILAADPLRPAVAMAAGQPTPAARGEAGQPHRAVHRAASGIPGGTGFGAVAGTLGATHHLVQRTARAGSPGSSLLGSAEGPLRRGAAARGAGATDGRIISGSPAMPEPTSATLGLPDALRPVHAARPGTDPHGSDGALGGPAPHAGRRLGAPAPAAPAPAGSSPVAQLAQEGSSGQPSPARSIPFGATIQRAVQVEEVSGDTAASTGERAGTGPGSATGAATGSGAGAGLAAATEGDLDALARRLYGRIRDRLAGELLLDRERSGSLADL